MGRDSDNLDRSVRRWWRWFTVALLLLIPLDLLTTLIAVAEHGTAVEANPIVRWLLQQGLLAIVVVNLVAGILAVTLFHVAVEQFRRVIPSTPHPFVLLVNLWIGVLVAIGTGLAIKNLLAVV
jgi:magnesium-transporting ATPase (P-type)